MHLENALIFPTKVTFINQLQDLEIKDEDFF